MKHRIRILLDPVNAEGSYVLYWMIAARRTTANFALERAVELANEHGVPLLVFEPLRAGYRWANDRHHTFIIEGMLDNEAACSEASVAYLPYVEPAPGDGKGMLARLASQAVAVVTDDWPGFFLPRMVEAAANQLSTRFEVVDSVGLLPVHQPRDFTTAASFRRHLQKTLPAELERFPTADPLENLRNRELAVHSEEGADLAALLAGGLNALPIDHSVGAASMRGGAIAAQKRLKEWIASGLSTYHSDRNHPDDGGGAGLSAWLHYGHLGAHETVRAVLDADGWTPNRLGPVTGSRGWWGCSEGPEAFMDEIVTWRELGHVMAARQPEEHFSYDGIPGWAQQTLHVHSEDERQYLYTAEEFEHAETHDELWNAAQRELVRTGRIHNYLRMLWGKGVLLWSATPREAFDLLEHLNNKYALDGRDPNSASGISWVFGRYDRAWGPERPVIGKVRYMTSASTRKKLHLKAWLRANGGA